MTTVNRQERVFSPEEYLALERASETRNEYFAGRIYAMAGASRDHNRIALNTASAVNAAGGGRECEAFAIELRVHIPATGLFTYPDVVVVCGEQRFADDRLDILLNPTVIFEVLSRSTEAYDRGDKFAHYRSIPSLQDYVLVAQDRHQVEHFSRRPDDEWRYTVRVGPDAVLRLDSIGIDLPLIDLYARIAFRAGVALRPAVADDGPA